MKDNETYTLEPISDPEWDAKPAQPDYDGDYFPDEDWIATEIDRTEAECERLGVGVEWQRDWHAHPLAEQKAMWAALSSDQRWALIDSWFGSQPFPNNDEGADDELPF